MARNASCRYSNITGKKLQCYNVVGMKLRTFFGSFVDTVS